MNNEQIIYGIRPLIEAVDNQTDIEKVYLTQENNSALYRELTTKLRKANIQIQYVPKERLDRMVKGNHQGVVAQIARIKYADFATLAGKTDGTQKKSLFVLLDRVTDVRNFGAIARSCECAGVDAIIIGKHNSAQINEDAVRTSQGALLNIPVCREENLKTTVNLAKQYNIKVVALTERADTIYYDCDLSDSILLLMGSEDTGINESLLKMCDEKVRIDMKGKIESLNVSVATGVVLFETVRQRAKI